MNKHSEVISIGFMPDLLRHALLVVVFLLFPLLITAQETDPVTFEEDVSVDSEETVSETDIEEEKAEDTRKLILLYGIDSEVLAVLSELRSEAVGSYNEVLLGVLADSRNSEIDRAIYGLWSETEWDGGLEVAAGEIVKVLDDEDYELNVVQSAVSYIAERDYQEALTDLGELAESRESQLAASAVRAIGKLAKPGAENVDSVGEVLLARLEKEDPLSEDDLVASLIVTLGSMEYQPAATELVLIVEDEGSPAGHRRMACISVGQIGRDDDYAVLETLYYESSDATLRSYALAGLAEFNDQDTTEILIQALKRDSFWRIRVTAADKLGDNEVGEAAELLRYKAVHDPIVHVRVASLKALGKISDAESQEFLLEYYTDKNKGTDVRLAALSVLVENKVDGTDRAVMEVMDELWEKDQGRFLEYTCRDLSRGEWDSLAPVFERMLSHENWLVQVYGIRGIRRNSFAGLEAKVDALDADGVDGKVRREVTAGS